MAEYNSPNVYPCLNDQQFGLNKLETISLARLKKEN